MVKNAVFWLKIGQKWLKNVKKQSKKGKNWPFLTLFHPFFDYFDTIIDPILDPFF